MFILISNEHSITLQSSLTQAEIWYQHIYDYFSGKTSPYDEQFKSPGMIYQNYLQFLRIVWLLNYFNNIMKD